MAPKVQFTKDYIIETALQLANEVGMDNVTVRKLASKMGCSVAPIYVNFKNTAELREAIVTNANLYLKTYMEKHYSDMQFFNMGIGQILYARDYPKLFIELSTNPMSFCKDFQDSNPMLDLMKQDPMVGDLSLEQMEQLLRKMSLMTFAIAFEVAISNDGCQQDLSHYFQLVHDTGYQLIQATKKGIGLEHQHLMDLKQLS